MYVDKLSDDVDILREHVNEYVYHSDHLKSIVKMKMYLYLQSRLSEFV